MYKITEDIDHKIAELQEQRDCLVLYWFEMGEADCNCGLAIQYPDNSWYVLGYQDRNYQLEIGFNSAPARL